MISVLDTFIRTWLSSPSSTSPPPKSNSGWGCELGPATGWGTPTTRGGLGNTVWALGTRALRADRFILCRAIFLRGVRVGNDDGATSAGGPGIHSRSWYGGGGGNWFEWWYGEDSVFVCIASAMALGCSLPRSRHLNNSGYQMRSF